MAEITSDLMAASAQEFINKLYRRAQGCGLKLRVVLEPRALVSTTDFPPGSEYVIMLYNLYGLHSGPGPKANKDFIETTLERMNLLPADKTVAFATGGCMWGRVMAPNVF